MERTPIRHIAIAKISLLKISANRFLNDVIFGILLFYPISKINLLLFLSATDNCVVAARSNLIYNAIEYSKYRKAGKCYDDIEQHIVKGKHLQDL